MKLHVMWDEFDPSKFYADTYLRWNEDVSKRTGGSDEFRVRLGTVHLRSHSFGDLPVWLLTLVLDAQEFETVVTCPEQYIKSFLSSGPHTEKERETEREPT
ncbi:hypothetical protein T265_07636 [Opisthorchis viverrini]|uniref:Uncharacterized protein n=1 Tax=Opisthorchis viverrini TaxID=6198 RepID=A0A074ZBS8_OPIVI|nr:hypothetical protein T265_07636 [Opisthorchis viverrini]KER24746.1 hypothetical protein T265_07636 [Opisthorchis viverrini]